MAITPSAASYPFARINLSADRGRKDLAGPPRNLMVSHQDLDTSLLLLDDCPFYTKDRDVIRAG